MAYLGHKKNIYYAVFSINGSKKWIRIGKVEKREAKKVLKQLEIEHLKEKLEIREIKETLLYDFLREYLQYSRTNKATNTYRLERGILSSLKSYFGNLPLKKLNSKAIENYKSHRVSKGLRPASTNRVDSL